MSAPGGADARRGAAVRDCRETDAWACVLRRWSYEVDGMSAPV